MIEGCSFSSADVAMEALRSGVVVTESSRCVVAEHKGEAPAISVPNGFEKDLLSEDRAGDRV